MTYRKFLALFARAQYASTALLVLCALSMQLAAVPRTLALRSQQQSTTLIPDGTELAVVTIDDISSKDATEGDPVIFA
jgi:hypothetical protein